MSSEHVEELSAMLARIDPELPPSSTVEVKHFFGGAAAYVDGRIFLSLTKVGLALKLPEADREQLFRSKQAKELRYFPKAPIKKQYTLFPKGLLNDCNSVATWIQRSAAFVVNESSASGG